MRANVLRGGGVMIAHRLFVLALLLTSLACPLGSAAVEPASEQPDIEVFVRQGCPHCTEAKRFLEDLQRNRPSLRVVLRDLEQDKTALRQLQELADRYGVRTPGVPTFYLRGNLIVGYSDAESTGTKITALLDQPLPEAAGSLPQDVCRIETDSSCIDLARPPPRPSDSIETPWFGRLSAGELGLPLFTIVIGLLDGFNPCAMWVLLFLLSLLVNLQDRRKMALIAGTFVLVSGLVYFAFMAAWLNIFLLIGLSRPIQIGLGGVALLVGMVNVKDFFALHRGISLSIPESAKPGLYARIRGILQADNLTGVLAGIVVLAGLVNIIELLCTAGFPALYTQILTLQQMPAWEYYGYLGLYNLAYIFDDSLMVMIAVVTLSRRKLQERAGRWLKLTSGLVMVGLGAVLLLQPKWLM